MTDSGDGEESGGDEPETIRNTMLSGEYAMSSCNKLADLYCRLCSDQIDILI